MGRHHIDHAPLILHIGKSSTIPLMARIFIRTDVLEQSLSNATAEIHAGSPKIRPIPWISIVMTSN
ncbi:MAG: hypothetical protein VYD89_00545 [Candidatus Thermoplasmatota archaeon]|nr:hypothetical protein [Candidatus Thermoplasmatota archaeon]